MDTSKIIIGTVGGGRYTVTAPIVKEDYGLYLKIEGLELPQTYEVDFSNSEHNGTSVTMIGNADGVLIPSQFIASGKDIFAFLYHVGSDYGRTIFKFRIPNKLRPDRTDDVPTPEEQSVIDQAIAALNNAVEQTAQDVINADASAQSASDSADRAEIAEQDAENAADVAHEYADRAETSASQASASATASANSASQSAQIKADVEDMVDDAQGYANSASQSASASANSASDAQGYANSASASAQSASGYASQAQTSAQTASAKAQDASGYAQTASTKATESAQSASLALTYKTDAESAKTASQTAQGLAEQAKADAITAKNDAESARDEAQNLVDGISGKVEQIDSNTECIESLEDDRYKPYAVDTASGAVASFSDGADGIPLKSLIVNIDPVQDTSSGDPSPENICPISGWTEVQTNQTGANVWDEEWEIGALVITTGANTADVGCFRSKNYIQLIPNATYFVYGTTIRFCFYDADKNFVESPFSFTNTTFTVPSNVAYVRFYRRVSPTVYNHNISINYPSTDHDYHPYTGRSITIDLGQTVYAGRLDVLTGKLTVYPYYASYNGETLTGRWISDRDVYAVGTTPTIGAQVVDLSGTGAEIQLELHEIASLLGINNIFADTGDASVEYRADPDLYIQRKMPDVPVDDVQINGSSIVNDGVANVPIASANDFGTVKTDASLGITINSSGNLVINRSSASQNKLGTDSARPIVPFNQHESTFYGLAKAAGDTTQSASSNAVGNYTEDAKSAISEMLGGSVSVSGTTPTITAKSGIRYVCGEVATLDLTPPASGICDVVFESGATATVLTVTPPTGQTVKWANGFDPTSLDANTTYEINIMDGLGVVGVWT